MAPASLVGGRPIDVSDDARVSSCQGRFCAGEFEETQVRSRVLDNQSAVTRHWRDAGHPRLPAPPCAQVREGCGRRCCWCCFVKAVAVGSAPEWTARDAATIEAVHAVLVWAPHSAVWTCSVRQPAVALHGEPPDARRTTSRPGGRPDQNACIEGVDRRFLLCSDTRALYFLYPLRGVRADRNLR